MSKLASEKIILPIICIVCCVLVILLQFGFIFLLMALMPTVVAFFVDFEPRKPLFKVVFCCNSAALMPSLMPMLMAGAHMKHYDVGSTMSDPNVWLLILSGAAAGWGLVYLCRFIARLIVTVNCDYLISALEAQQKRLVDEWGEKIVEKERSEPETESENE